MSETDAETVAGTLGVSPAASSEQGPITPDRSEIDPLLDALDRLLSNDDAEVNRTFADAAPALRRSLGEEIVTLGRMIDTYEYPAALERVRALRARS
ncbi:hypothetical protein THIOKS11460004 [Thiocapsa sp. KS1]|nr:hypothetical protein [Thiocapsa sp. KS1]CRI63705.1 hypothetical protein THIOKS11460004 [Thiocapsa sp. KS1]